MAHELANEYRSRVHYTIPRLSIVIRRGPRNFILDRTDNGGTSKMITLLIEYSRQPSAIQVEQQITATQVLGVLELPMIQVGVPSHIRSDNAPEFITSKVQQWLRDNRIKTIYMDAGSP